MTPNLTPESRALIDEALSRRNWSLPGDHPISALDGLQLDTDTVLAILGPRNAVGSRYFQLFLADAEGRLADGPLALGLFGQGPYPAFNWVEMTQFRESLQAAGRTIDLWATGQMLQLFAAESALVPAGGHIMAEYDSPTHKATERILTLRYPPATTPIGYSLFEAGVRSYRDWYISEGGREGPRKLQGFKPLNEEIAREKTAALRAEIEAVLARPEDAAHGEWGGIARVLGRKVLATIL
jgi:hypothetical protein